MTGARAFALAGIVFGAVLVPARAGAVDRDLGAAIARPATSGSPWSARQTRRLGRDLDALLAAAPALRGAHVGLIAVDARSGAVLYSRNADDAFVPASTLKLLTGSAALALLGPGYRFHTSAYVGPPDGTLFIRAGGDPLLRSDDIAALTRAAVAAGALRNGGGLSIDARAFEPAPYPPGWSWDDFAYDYAAPLTPLPVDENAWQLTISAGSRAGDPVIVHAPGAAGADERFAAERCAPSGAPAPATTGPAGSPVTLDVVRNERGTCFSVVGSLPAGAQPQTLGVAMIDPGALISRLVVAGAGRLAGPAIAAGAAPVPVDARLVWSHDGEPLRDLLADMWWPSDNFVAELLLRAIGRQQGAMPGTTEGGAAAERAWLTGIGVDPATLTIADGSGLSSYDRLTPRALVAILQADWNGPNRASVIDDLPLAGVRGTLDTAFAGSLAARRTFAKTGSVNHARGLAGYLATLRHGAVTFAWSVDDWMGTDTDLQALRARVLSRLIGD